MKKASIFLFLIIITCNAHAGINDGLVAYYPFNGNANDESGNGNNGTLYGPILTSDSKDINNRAYSFDGIDDYILCGNNASLNPESAVTVSAWIFINGFPLVESNYDTGWAAIIDKGISYHFGLNAIYGLTFTVFSGTHYKGFWRNIPPENDFLLQQWYHVVGSFDEQSGEGYLYINGVRQYIEARWDNGWPTTLNPSNKELKIGNENSDSPGDIGNQWLNGKIDEVRIYNRMLAESDIQELYNLGKPYNNINEGLVAYYPFNGNANDESGNGNNGTVHGAALTADRSANANSAYYFDGVNDYIEVADSPSLKTTPDFSISLWFNNISNNERGRLLTKGPDLDRDYHIFWETWNNPPGTICANICAPSSVPDVAWSRVLSLNNWYHLTFVVIGRNQIKLFINGALESSINITSVPADTSQPLLIGAYPGPRQVFNGIIDDIRIYNRALSENEINELFSLPPKTLPDTGQTKCYNNSAEIPCPQPGQPFYGQDAQYGPNHQSYTDLGNGIVKDNVTGLEWQQATAPGTYTWQEAINYCENLTLGGYDDWRLPTIKELSTLVDSSRFSPAIDNTFFPGTVASQYWSSTTDTYNVANAWSVKF